jgi:hypothetical protein
MEKTRLNINSVYDIIKLRRKYSTASNEKSHKKIVLTQCKFVNERVYFFFKKLVMGICFLLLSLLPFLCGKVTPAPEQ